MPAKDSFRIAYDEHADFVGRLLRYLRVPPNEQEDAAQEVFLALHLSLHRLGSAEEVKPYLYGIVKNVCAKRRRWSARFMRHFAANAGDVLELAPDEQRPTPERQTAMNADFDMLARLLDTLDEAQRDLVILVDCEDCTLDEVARHTDTNRNTVASRLHTAREALHRAFQRELARDTWRLRWTT